MCINAASALDILGVAAPAFNYTLANTDNY